MNFKPSAAIRQNYNDIAILRSCAGQLVSRFT